MNLRRFLMEAATLVFAAAVCALISNALASRERKVALVGNYPDAQKVSGQSVAPALRAATAGAKPVPAAAAAPAHETTATTRPAPSAAHPAPAQDPSTTATTTPPAPDLSRFSPHMDKPYAEVGYDDVAVLHAAHALFLDARRTSIYEQGHIAGARPFSVWESDVDQRVSALFDERGDPRQQALPIVVYCSGGECEDSHMLAQKLWGVQFNNVYVYRDGFPDWQKHGAAVHVGGQP